MEEIKFIAIYFNLKGSYTLTNARTTIQTSSGPAWGATLCGMSMEWTGMRNDKWAPPWMGYDEPLSPATGNKIALPCVFQVNHPKFFFSITTGRLTRPKETIHKEHVSVCSRREPKLIIIPIKYW